MSARAKKIPSAQCDDQIIAACIRYASVRAAASAAFKADPDPNCKSAEKLDRGHLRMMRRALVEATAKAETCAGLRAKGLLLAKLPDDDGIQDEEAIEFAASVGRDVAALFDKWFRMKEPGPLADVSALR